MFTTIFGDIGEVYFNVSAQWRLNNPSLSGGFLIDDVQWHRVNYSLPNITVNIPDRAINSELMFVNSIQLGAPPLISDGGNALRLDTDSNSPANTKFGGLFMGRFWYLQNCTIEMWFRFLEPITSSTQRNYTLFSRIADNDNGIVLQIDTQKRMVEGRVYYNNRYRTLHCLFSVKWSRNMLPLELNQSSLTVQGTSPSTFKRNNSLKNI